MSQMISLKFRQKLGFNCCLKSHLNSNGTLPEPHDTSCAEVAQLNGRQVKWIREDRVDGLLLPPWLAPAQGSEEAWGTRWGEGLEKLRGVMVHV